MIKKFSYPIPDELYVDSFSEKKEISLVYDGPETINVLVDKNTSLICGINPDTYDTETYNLVEVSAEENPHICYYLLNSSYSHEYEYEEEVMENGDLYNNVINPSLHDAYLISYDPNSDTFNLDLIVKVSDDNFLFSQLFSIKNRLLYVLSNEEGKKAKNEPIDVSDEIIELVSNTISDIDDYINSNIPFMEWKYSNFDTVLESRFQIPAEIKNLLETYQ